MSNCFDYSKIGCKSSYDCINKCKIELSLKLCNKLPPYAFMDKHNDKDVYSKDCYINHAQDRCKDKFKSSDCLNQYFIYKPFSVLPLNESSISKFQMNILTNKTNHQANLKKFTAITINFSGQPDIIYSHLPKQLFGELIFSVGEIIALWIGFYVLVGLPVRANESP